MLCSHTSDGDMNAKRTRAMKCYPTFFLSCTNLLNCRTVIRKVLERNAKVSSGMLRRITGIVQR